MIFSQGLDDRVRDGTKTQTRRLVKEGDEATYAVPSGEIAQVYRNGKLLWEGYKTYAIQSGRGKKGNGRFRILKIRRESLQDISEADVIAEGIPKRLNGSVMKQRAFKHLWDSIHKKSGTRWEDNPENWVLEIEPINGR